jgi:hypothetical protein
MRENQVGEWKKTKIKVIGARLAAIGLHASLISGGTTKHFESHLGITAHRTASHLPFKGD